MFGCGGVAVQAVQQGIPLNDFTLSKMSPEEREFWKDFLKEADQVIGEEHDKRDMDKRTKKAKNFILIPSPSLQAKYNKAIVEHDGEKYCQIQQLKNIFVFKDETLEE